MPNESEKVEERGGTSTAALCRAGRTRPRGEGPSIAPGAHRCHTSEKKEETNRLPWIKNEKLGLSFRKGRSR